VARPENNEVYDLSNILIDATMTYIAKKQPRMTVAEARVTAGRAFSLALNTLLRSAVRSAVGSLWRWGG